MSQGRERNTGTVFLRLLEVRGPRRSLSPPPASVPRRAHARGESRFQRDQDAITLNGKKLWLPERKRERERMQLEKLRARSFIPSKKIRLRDVQLRLHSVKLGRRGYLGRGGPANSYRSYAFRIIVGIRGGAKWWRGESLRPGIDDAA